MVDEKALEDASRAYCDVIRLNYEALPAPLAAKRDEAMRAAIAAYLKALSPGSTGETEGWREGKPPNDSTVLVVCAATPKNNAFAGRRDVMPIYVGPDGKFDPDPTNESWRVTHWRPLPAPPSAMLSVAG